MVESIHRYFKVGAITWMSYPNLNPVEAVRRVVIDDFFDAIEVTKFEDSSSRDNVKNMLANAHVKICYGAQPSLLAAKLNPNHLDDIERQRAVDLLIAAIDEAEYLGAKGIAFLSGKWEKENFAEAYSQLLKTTRTICDYAAEKQMMVELEVFDYDMDKASIIGPAPLAAEFAADMRKTHRNFGLLVDLSHFPTTYEDSTFVVRTLRPYITHFHIGNAVVKPGCAAYGDQHPRFGFENSANDTEQLIDFFRVLKNEGFFNSDNPYVLSIEVKPYGDEDPDIVMANTKRVINRAWSMV